MNYLLVLALLAGVTTLQGHDGEHVVSPSLIETVQAQPEESGCTNDAEPKKVHNRPAPVPLDWQKIKVAQAQKKALIKAEFESILTELRIRHANDLEALAAAELGLRRALLEEPIK